MYFKKSLAVLSLASILAVPAFAGDIQPLHPDGILRSLGSGATATDILYANCHGISIGGSVSHVLVRVKDRYPMANPRVRARVIVDTTPTTPCPTAPTALLNTTIDYSDSKFSTEALKLSPGLSGFSSPSVAGVSWVNGVSAKAAGAGAGAGTAPGSKYCIYVDKVVGTVTTTGVNAGKQTTTGTNVGLENYELYAHCQLGTSEVAHVHTTPRPLLYQQNQ